jgi:branched-chain amino acid transport system ATP-binding protein
MVIQMQTDPIVETRDLTIRFGGHVAVNRVNLQVAPFALKSIIGPNGAGKTTLFNLMTGQYKPTEGSVFLKGKEIPRLSAVDRPASEWGGPFN